MKKAKIFAVIPALLMLMFNHQISNGCTNFLITRGASVDGSTMVTYSADSHNLYGELYFQPAQDHPEGAMRDIYEWDTGKFLGKIPQPRHTYSVVGNMNQFQLAIGETTFGGREELATQEGAIMDYGSLIYVTLQRAKTAREAIQVIADLVEKYGYYSSGESFSIADPNEVWLMELIGKGKDEKGAVWVALKIPDGYISGHANQARITTFPKNDPENCIYTPDVISFAKKKGWFNGTDEEFSFSDVYAPVDFGGARFCEARVWSGFNQVASGMEKYVDYAKGLIQHDEKMNFAVNRMPLWIKPDKKLSVRDVQNMMRDHYEGTELDMSTGFGAGTFELPYRFGRLTWQIDSVEYCNERPISTRQTGFSFVSQSRNWLPDPVGGILWFGVDDTYVTCYVPMYCGITEIPECFAEGNGDLLTYSPTSAFWTFNKVSNFAYLRYNEIIPDIQKIQNELENNFEKFVPIIDESAKNIYQLNGAEEAGRFLTKYSVNEAGYVTKRWEKLWEYLLVKFLDGNIKREKDGEFERTETGVPPYPHFPEYPDWWYRELVKQTGDHFKVIE